MYTKKIRELTEQQNMAQGKINDIEGKLMAAYHEYFSGLKPLQEALNAAMQASEYSMDCDGEIISWYRANILSDFEGCKNYLEDYVHDQGFDIDWDNTCLTLRQGQDSLIIQDDSISKRGNGVWCESKQVIAESEYTTEDGEVDDTKRNALIEAYMEKTGVFPGVFRVTRNGDVLFVNTTAAVATDSPTQTEAT